mmetsp:Transcript_27953/g.79080  ORF Transcript_27953/g.79080 Transcript_27953/m.79080 type:complete len:314 (+) Transcript_27953:171-1112(+)
MFQWWRKVLNGAPTADQVLRQLPPTRQRLGEGAFVACVVDFDHETGEPMERKFARSLAGLVDACKPMVRSGHKRGNDGTSLPKEHAGWGKMAMAGLTFRPGDGTPQHIPGIWRYCSWVKGCTSQQMESILQDVQKDIDTDWSWLEKTCPGVCMEYEEAVQGLPHFVEVASIRERVFMGSSPWCCLSVGDNYHAAPHKDCLDLCGALIRFVDDLSGHSSPRCCSDSNEFVMPELGVVVQTPSMAVLWCRTDKVRHGTMEPWFPETAFGLGFARHGVPRRLASARQLKRSVVNRLRKAAGGIQGGSRLLPAEHCN